MSQSRGMSLGPRPCDFNEMWPTLKDCIEAVISNRRVEHSTWEDCFYYVYRLCIASPNSHCVRLYNKVKECIESYVDREREELVALDGSELLTTYYEKWRVYFNGTSSVDSLFRYLNVEYISKQCHTDVDVLFSDIDFPKSPLIPIGQLVLETWKERLVEPLLSVLTAQLLRQIEIDRNGQNVDHSTIFGVIHSFIQMESYKPDDEQFYESAFESKHIEATVAYYTRVALALLQTCSVSEYMEQVIEKIEDERCRSRKFLPERSIGKITSVCQEVLVRNQYELVKEIIPQIMGEENKKDLKNMFLLLKPVTQDTKALMQAYEDHIKKACIQSIGNLSPDNIGEQFVEEILRIYEKYNEFTTTIFEGHSEFVAALDRACMQAVNHKEEGEPYLKAAEWLAKYADRLLRKSTKVRSDKSLESALNKAILVLRYIDEKDVFRQVYGMLLAKRLITGTSVSLVGEETMISLLKTACGFEFVSKFARMVTDVEMSRQFTSDVNAYLESMGITVEVPFNVMVLQSGSWPLNARYGRLDVPSSVTKVAQSFEDVYRKHHSGRKLTWLYHVGTVEVALTYLPQPYTVSMNLYQYVILQCFNRVSEMKEDKLLEATGIDPADLFEKNLQSLLEGHILIKDCDGKDAPAVIRLNMMFSSKHRKVKLHMPTFKINDKELSKESSTFSIDVGVDRKHYLECIVVRLMKLHKIMKHSTLIKEAMIAAAPRFSPDVPFIKQTIENLIDKNYLKRTENAEEYAYLA